MHFVLALSSVWNLFTVYVVYCGNSCSFKNKIHVTSALCQLNVNKLLFYVALIEHRQFNITYLKAIYGCI